MNNNDFEDIFLENEKLSFHKDLDEMNEEPHGEKLVPPSLPQANSGSHIYAYPQDNNFPNFFRNDGQIPEWFRMNKKLGGLSGFITLGDHDSDDDFSNNQGFENMDIQSLSQQDWNLNLGKFFEENREFSRRNSGMEGIMHHNDKNFRKPSIPARKHSRSQEKIFPNEFPAIQEKTSFFKGYLPMLLERNWKEILENASKFQEFEQNFDAQKNVENLMFMEEHKDTHGRAFEEIYFGYYTKIISKLQECMEGYSLTGELILKVLYDEVCGLLSELFNFIRNCTSDFCFDLMKKTSKNTRSVPKVPANNIVAGATSVTPDSVSVPIPAAVFNNEQRLEKTLSPPQSQPSIHHQTPEYVSNTSWQSPEAEETKVEAEPDVPQARPLPAATTMTIENLESLSQLIDLNVRRRDDNAIKPVVNIPNYRGLENISIATSEIESVASENTRRSQRKYWSAAELQELENLSVQYHPNSIPLEQLEEFARKYNRTLNAIQSKISKTKKERKRNVDVGPIVGALRPTPASLSKKYEVSVEKMIKGALQQYPDNVATKSEIIEKVKEMFFRENIQFDAERLTNSISQTLSASKSIGKLKGTFSLRSRAFMMTNIADAKTMKSRLQYILTNANGNKADIDGIRRMYWEYFNDTTDADGVWETSITKILKQSNEFDTSNCRTKYYLLARTGTM